MWLKITYLAGNKNKSDRFTIPIDWIPSIMESIQFTIKILLCTTASNLSKLCATTKFVLGNIAQLKARNLHKIIPAELTWGRLFRLHENNKANKEIIFLRNNLIRLNSCVLHPYQVPTVLFFIRKLSHDICTIFLKEGKNIYALNFSVSTK